MELAKALEILETEKGIAELDLSNGEGNTRTQEFIDAVNTVLDFINELP